MRFVGNGTIEFHKNFSVERYGTCDSLDFERMTQAWGNFKECSCGQFAFSGADCPAGGRTKHAGGKSLLMLDVNGDQQQDLIFSEASCGQLFLFQNEGTLTDPVISTFSSFPSTNPVSFSIFPASFYEDVDFDGKKDLLSSPNIFSKSSLGTDLQHSNWFYKNTGSNSNPIFTFSKTNFLQETMIDVGDNAVPAFADYDGDGDYDMFISRNSSENFKSTIVLYENTGSAKEPTFKHLTDNYLGFSYSVYYNLKIQFADMDRDNTLDLVFTGTNFENGSTYLYFVPNKSQNVFDFSGQQIVWIDFKMTFNENLYITDVNSDGRPDILAGRSNGSLEYWRNTELPPQFNFILEKSEFLGLGSSVLRQNVTCATADLDADGKADLIFGDQSGKLKIVNNYRNAEDATAAQTEIVFNPLLNRYTEQNLGGKTWPVIVNLFNSNKPTIAVGNILGGIQILRHDEGESLPDIPLIDVFPNPIERTETLNLKIDRVTSIQIISLLGQQVSDPILLQAHETYQYKLSSLPAGLYFLKFTVNKKSFTKRLVVL